MVEAVVSCQASVNSSRLSISSSEVSGWPSASLAATSCASTPDSARPCRAVSIMRARPALSQARPRIPRQRGEPGIELENKILAEARERAEQVLSRERGKMDALTAVLLEKETVEQEEFRRVMADTIEEKKEIKN